MSKYTKTLSPPDGEAWLETAAGKRDRFPSRRVQEEMLLIWANLLEGMKGRLTWEKYLDYRTFADGSPKPLPEMRFDERVLKERLINAFGGVEMVA
jgi:hypothetical protein